MFSAFFYLVPISHGTVLMAGTGLRRDPFPTVDTLGYPFGFLSVRVSDQTTFVSLLPFLETKRGTVITAMGDSTYARASSSAWVVGMWAHNQGSVMRALSLGLLPTTMPPP